MNRFFRTAYSTTLTYLYLTLLTVSITGIGMPFLSFSCLFFGLLVFLLPSVVRKLQGREVLCGILGALIALAGFLFLLRRPVIHIAAHGIGIAAAALYLVVLRFNTKHSDFEAKFRFSVIATACVVFIFVIAGMTDTDFFILEKEDVLQALYSIVPLAIVLLAAGVLLLRGLRSQQGIVDEASFNRRQLRDTVVFAAIVSAVFAANPFVYLNKAVNYIIDNVIQPLSKLIGKGFSALLDLLVNRNPPPPGGGAEVETTMLSGDITPAPELPEITLDPAEVQRNSDDLYRTLVTIFFIAAAIVVLIILIRELVKLIKKLKLGGDGAGFGYPNEVREKLDPEEGRKKDKPARLTRDPRLRMRNLYRDYLHYLRSMKINKQPTDTCSEINRRAEYTLRRKQAETEEFTELYETARYCRESEPNRRDADRMKRLLGEIRDKED